MNLTADQLMELIIAVSDGAKRLPDHEKRRAPRISMKFPVRIRLLNGVTGDTGSEHQAWLKDVSSGGLGLVTSEPFDDGASFIIDLPRLGGRTTELLCLCMHARALGDGMFQVGGQFIAEWSRPFAEPAIEHEAMQV